MPINRFYTPKTLRQDEKIVITGNEVKHISRVLRKAEGDVVELTNGNGTLAIAAIRKISNRQIELVVQRSQSIPKPSSEMILVQPLLHKSKLEWILEKTTELGVDQFWFFTAKKGMQKTLSETTTQRFEAIVIAAGKQSGRVWFPKIKSYLSLKDIPVPFSSTCYFGTIEKDTTPITVPSNQTDPVLLFVGPESGWSDDEMVTLRDQFQAMPFAFNKNILRAETASVSGIAILRYFLAK